MSGSDSSYDYHWECGPRHRSPPRSWSPYPQLYPSARSRPAQHGEVAIPVIHFPEAAAGNHVGFGQRQQRVPLFDLNGAAGQHWPQAVDMLTQRLALRRNVPIIVFRQGEIQLDEMTQVEAGLVLHAIVGRIISGSLLGIASAKVFWSGKSRAFCTSLNSGPSITSGDGGTGLVSTAWAASVDKAKIAPRAPEIKRKATLRDDVKPISSWGILLIISDGLATAFDHQKTLDEYLLSGVLQVTFCVKTDNLPACPGRQTISRAVEIAMSSRCAVIGRSKSEENCG